MAENVREIADMIPVEFVPGRRHNREKRKPKNRKRKLRHIGPNPEEKDK